MKYFSATFSFIFVFLCAFILAGWFLMPHLPPVPDHVVTVFELDYLKDNWAGYILGVTLGGLSARSVLKKSARQNRE